MHLWLRRKGILGKGAKRTIDLTDWINENAVSSVPCNIANTPLKNTPKKMFLGRRKNYWTSKWKFKYVFYEGNYKYECNFANCKQKTYKKFKYTLAYFFYCSESLVTLYLLLQCVVLLLCGSCQGWLTQDSRINLNFTTQKETEVKLSRMLGTDQNIHVHT